MPVIVIYYLPDKFVNLFLHHRRRFWVANEIMIIYVKIYLACCSLQVSWNKYNKLYPYMSYVYIKIRRPHCYLKTCCKKCS